MNLLRLLLLLGAVLCYVDGVAGAPGDTGVRDVGSVRHPEVYLAAARPRHTPGLGTLKAHALYVHRPFLRPQPFRITARHPQVGPLTKSGGNRSLPVDLGNGRFYNSVPHPQAEWQPSHYHKYKTAMGMSENQHAFQIHEPAWKSMMRGYPQPATAVRKPKVVPPKAAAAATGP